VLARLDHIEGVERSFANRSGNLVRLSLRPGADPDKVAGDATQILSGQAKDRVPVRLSAAELSEVLQKEEWRDEGRVRELSAIERRTLIARALLPLGLGAAAVGCGVFWWRRRKLRAANEVL